jgi:phenylacetate-coenzyme A ligase PaaK-like adenylate-forming protein
MFLHPNQLLAAKTFYPEIKHIQAIVTRPENNDHILIKVELNEGAASEGLADKLKTLAQQAIRLRIDEVEFVEPGGINPSERTVKDNRTWE